MRKFSSPIRSAPMPENGITLELPQVISAISTATTSTTVIEYVSPVVIFWTSPEEWAGMRLIKTNSTWEFGDFEAEATAGATITYEWEFSGSYGPEALPPEVTIVDNIATVAFSAFDFGGGQFIWTPGTLTLTAAKDGLTHTAILRMIEPA